MVKLFLRFAFWSAATFALVMALLPHPPTLHTSDKLQHMAAFATLGILGSAAYRRVGWVKIFVGLVLFGAGIELAQGLSIIHRDSQLSDLVADVLATGAALLLVAAVRHLYRSPAKSR